MSEAGPDDAGAAQRRGQGPFVAKTYTARMGGTVLAENADGGARIVLALPRVIS